MPAYKKLVLEKYPTALIDKSVLPFTLGDPCNSMFFVYLGLVPGTLIKMVGPVADNPRNAWRNAWWAITINDNQTPS